MFVAILLLSVFSLRYWWGYWLEQQWWWTTYLLELIFVLLAFVLYRKDIKRISSWKAPSLKASLCFLVGGMMCRLGIGAFGFHLPWDLGDMRTALLLLLLAPSLEELLYRGSLWILVGKVTKNQTAVWLSTSLLFSLSHLYPIWFVDTHYSGMIIFQSIYTLFLGLACGHMIKIQKSLRASIVCHFLFNLGFYLVDRGL